MLPLDTDAATPWYVGSTAPWGLAHTTAVPLDAPSVVVSAAAPLAAFDASAVRVADGAETGFRLYTLGLMAVFIL